MNNNLIITIGREYGTGGREIGQKLALRLGVPLGGWSLSSWAISFMTGN